MQSQVSHRVPSPIFSAIINSQNVVLLTIFISLLDDEQVTLLAQGAQKQNRQEKFFKIIVAKHFMKCYLNRVDRSLFFLFYEDPLFAPIEYATTNSLAATLYPYLLNALNCFQKGLNLFKQHTLFLTQQSALQEIVQAIFFNPDLPLPRMKRQTIAMFASTPLQQHLALLGEEDEAEWAEEPLEQLRAEVEREVEEREGGWGETERAVVEKVRFRGYLVTNAQIEEYLLDGFRTHNVVVLLLGLCSQIAETYLAVLNNIEDPMMRFTQFLLRANLYRNIVLALEDKFGFLNSAYSTLYARQYNPPPSIPPFSIYRAALSMWIQHSTPLQTRNEKVYCYVINKLRENNLLAHIGERSQKMPTFYGQLKDALDLQEFSQQAKTQAYSENQNQIELEGFFQDNLEMYEVIAKDYQDYLMDISVNQYTVHWCGHSQQKTAYFKHYTAYADILVRQSIRFCNFLKEKIKGSFPSQLRMSVLRELLREDLQFQFQKITCASILRRMVESLNEEIRQYLSTEGGIFFEEGLGKYLLQWDFTEKDDLVAYFAGKAEISEDCPAHLAFYYNLQDDAGAVPPKMAMEDQESVQSEEQEVYESEEEEV